jgi:hypothetical protein
MRGTFLGLLAAGGLMAAMAAAQAAPVARPDTHAMASSGGIIEVRGGCGPGWHPVRWVNRWGYWRVRCVRNW